MPHHRLALLVSTALALPAFTAMAQNHPNLVFIMADQWRGQALGHLGIEPVQTPNIDSLAGEGVCFTNAMSSYPVSSPARGMLMTGMYPTNSKVTGNCNSETAQYGVELPTEARCWSDVLKDQDYELGYIGKWHLDSPHKPYIDTYNNRGAVAWNEWCPQERRHGFGHWIAYGTYDNHVQPMYWNTDAMRNEYYFVDQWGPEYETDRAIEYIANKDNALRDGSKPFALVVSMNPPHTGYDLVPEKYKALYKNLDIEALCSKNPLVPAKGTKEGDYFRKSIADYYACMTGVDHEVGRIVQQLKEQGLFDNTIVVFTSDHGDNMGMHHHIGKNIYYEESMRVPMVITWPEKIAPRHEPQLQIAFADLYPTLLSLMGYKEQIPQEVQTYDLSSAILSPAEVCDIVQPYYYVNFDNPTTGYRGLRTNRYTFVVHATNGTIDEHILFDRQQDPYQQENIAHMQPRLVEQFTQQLKQWLINTKDPFLHTSFLYKRGATVADPTAFHMPQAINIAQLPTTVLTEENMPENKQTVCYNINLPEYKQGIFFSRDLRPADHQWPNNTNRLLPWVFNSLQELCAEGYSGIPSNGTPGRQGDALLLELANGEFLFAKALAADNSISWFEADNTGTLSARLSTLGNDCLPATAPVLLVEKGATAYQAIQKAYTALMANGNVSALKKRSEKEYFEAFNYLGWCSWEHYHYDIDEAKMLNDLHAIEQSAIPVRYVLIDDGHVANSNQQLTSLVPDGSRFPNGWKNIISHKKDDKIKWMGLWYNFCGYWKGIAPNNSLPTTMKESLFLHNGTMLPGKSNEKIDTFYKHYVSTLKDYGFDFLKIDNQSFMLPLYMGGNNVIGMARECNLALERQTQQHGMALMNCMAQNVINTDHTLHSSVARVSIDYKKYDENMAKSHLFQSYTNSLLQGQTVWPDHDMFHSCDTICGALMARSKAMSGAPVYLSDSPADFVSENILPLINTDGKLFRPEAPAIPMPESIITNPLQSGKAYRVFAPTGSEGMSIVCYNLNTSAIYNKVMTTISKTDYLLRETLTEKVATMPERLVLYNWAEQTAKELDNTEQIELEGFTDQLFHLCPVVDGWGVIGVQEKFLSPSTFTIVERTKKKLTINVLCPGTLKVYVDAKNKTQLRSIKVSAGRITIKK